MKLNQNELTFSESIKIESLVKTQLDETIKLLTMMKEVGNKDIIKILESDIQTYQTIIKKMRSINI